MGQLLLFAGGAIMLIAHLWLLILSFQKSVLWGFALLCLSPFALLVFVVVHWREAGRAFGLLLLGALLASAGSFLGGGRGYFERSRTVIRA